MPEIDSFVAPAVRVALDKMGATEPLASALSRIDVQLLPSQPAELGDVPESLSVTLSLKVRDKDITLLSSTRYDSQRLVQFAGQFGWDLVSKVPSPQNRQFVQFCFERRKRN